jgi:hypothetical protein
MPGQVLLWKWCFMVQECTKGGSQAGGSGKMGYVSSASDSM